VTGVDSGALLYPRLPASAAERVLAELRALPPDARASRGATSHLEAAPAPVGGHPVPAEHLAELQQAVRALTIEFGYPERLSAKRQADFDRQLATLLLSKMDIVTADAASTEVWSFVSFVLLPEVPFWRFPDAADGRYLKGLRNTFGRLWWRAWTLGPDLTQLPPDATPFGEDDFVQVMERPTISGNQRLARAFYEVVLESRVALTRSELVRKLAIQIRARRAHIAIDALDDQQLVGMIRAVRDSL